MWEYDDDTIGVYFSSEPDMNDIPYPEGSYEWLLASNEALSMIDSHIFLYDLSTHQITNMGNPGDGCFNHQ